MLCQTSAPFPVRHGAGNPTDPHDWTANPTAAGSRLCTVEALQFKFGVHKSELKVLPG